MKPNISDLVYVNAYTITKIFVIERTVDNTILLDNKSSLSQPIRNEGLLCIITGYSI
jgi:hypothetical protein